jgi:hypothetical protein
MDIAQRSLMVKANLYETMGTTKVFNRVSLEYAICNSGLSPKSSSIQKVISYLIQNRHIKKCDRGLYKVLYRRKDEARPKGIPNLLEKKVDINYFVSKQGLYDDDYLYPVLFNDLVKSVRRLKSRLKEKGECLIKFQIV